MGSVAGVGSAYGLLRGLIGIIPFNLPVTGPIQIDATVLGFTIVVSFVTTLLFTIVPFFSNTRVSWDESRELCRDPINLKQEVGGSIPLPLILDSEI
jgi:hypothetical protein